MTSDGLVSMGSSKLLIFTKVSDVFSKEIALLFFGFDGMVLLTSMTNPHGLYPFATSAPAPPKNRQSLADKVCKQTKSDKVFLQTKSLQTKFLQTKSCRQSLNLVSCVQALAVSSSDRGVAYTVWPAWVLSCVARG